MLKHFSYSVAYVLLLLMPVQALATASMLVCNSVMQLNVVKHEAKGYSTTTSEMPCHQQITTKSSHHCDSKASCKAICINLCSLTAMPVQIQYNFALNPTQTFDSNYQLYVSIPQQSLQRPPITFI